MHVVGHSQASSTNLSSAEMPASRGQETTAEKQKIIWDQESISILKALKAGRNRAVKIVAAQLSEPLGQGLLLAVGDPHSYHAVIIDRASRGVLGKSVVSTPNPDTSKPLPGAVIEGGKVQIDWKTGKAEVFDYSMSFGGFGRIATPSAIGAMVESLAGQISAGTV